MKFKWSHTGQEATLEDLQACVGKGWARIIENMAEDLFALGWDGTVAQIKEKFGALRFYFEPNGIPDKFRRVALAVELMHEGQSMSFCEACGKSGIVRRGGWIKTLCTEHALAEGRQIEDWEKPHAERNKKDGSDG